MDRSARGAPGLRRDPERRPPTSHSSGPYDTGLALPPPPAACRTQQLRPSKSAALLRPATRHQCRGGLDDPAPPCPPLPSPGPEERAGLRRVQSSSALCHTAPPPMEPQPPPEPEPQPSRWMAALGEAQYVASGLISHPVESTRHYSIVRHSHGLVWYRGPSTSVSITILADEPLPAARCLWLQPKGYSGHVGMAVKALVGARAGWIDVTPAREARADHMPEADERAIQRDLRRFAKGASGRARAHAPRETHLVRIPAAAADGYYRLVLCAGPGAKAVLCGCPAFRIASTSADAAVVRGASLATMPLEVGVKVASTIGQQVVGKYAGVAQSRAAKAAKHAAVGAALRGCQASGLAAAANDGRQRCQRERRDRGAPSPEPAAAMASDAGPAAPFPLAFGGRVAAASGWSTAELGYPTANLRGVPDAITSRLAGAFAAWAMVLPAKGLHGVDNGWHEAIVAMAPARDAAPAVAMRNRVAVHVAFDFGGATFCGAELCILLMGYLGPSSPPAHGPAELAAEHARHVATTLACLSRDSWRPREAAAGLGGPGLDKDLPDMLAEAAHRVLEQLERIPLHWAGVRSESATSRDRVYGNGGLWVAR